MSDKIKVLQLAKKFPYPLRDGESIAIYNISRSLVAEGCEVTLLTMNTSKHYVDQRTVGDNLKHYQSLESISVDTKINIWGAFKNLFSTESYHISRFISHEFEQKLVSILSKGDFDVIQLETLYLTPYIKTIREYSNAHIVLRSHNVEHEIWERIINNTSLVIKKWYLKYLTQKLKHYEQSQLNYYDSIITVSDRDLSILRKLGFKKEGFTIPIGLDLESYDALQETNENNESISLCFIGAMDWTPNKEGLEWFLNEIWPEIRSQFPNTEFHMAGRNTHEGVLNLCSSHCTHHGEVDSAKEFISRYDIMIVPLLSGSGTRVKILESLAIGTPVISTSIGCEGIGLQPGKEILIANKKSEYISALQQIASDHKLYDSIIENGKRFIELNYDQNLIGKRLYEYYLGIRSYQHN